MHAVNFRVPVDPITAAAAPPVIGITTYVEQARWGAWDMPSALTPLGYVAQVAAAGGRPLLVPPLTSGAQQTAAALDGLVLAGGADLDPALYDQTPHKATGEPRTDRDDGERALIREALACKLPLLGICRGVELLNVALGGDLVQHLPDRLGHDGHRGRPGEFLDHAVWIEPVTAVGVQLAGTMSVRSFHHQGLGRLGDQLEPFAWAADGIVEAVQHRELPFAVGVLWHPEASQDPRLFSALIDAARNHRDRQQLAAQGELP